MLSLLAAAVALPAGLQAQNAPATLTLGEALTLARRHNPDYQATRNDQAEADWAVREAYGSLIPGAGAGMGFQYQARGTPRFGTFTGGDLGISETPAYYVSDYSLGLQYRLSGATIYQVGAQKASQRATSARIEAADFQLTAAVTRQYLGAVRARDAVVLAEQELVRAEENLKLATARVAVGAAIPLERMQAEVERGRAEVTRLQAEAMHQTEKLRLVQALGLDLDRDIELTTSFDVFPLPWSREDLLARARQGHPQLRSLRALEDAGDAGVRMARTSYLPTLDFSAGWSGYTREAGNSNYLLNQARERAESNITGCNALNEILTRLARPLPAQDCTTYGLSADDERDILSSNKAFPFDFTRQPLVAQLRISLPLFDGFNRQRQLESAKAARDDARHRLRGEQLKLSADLGAAYLATETAEKAFRLEERNRELADEQLRLARERYRVGAASFLELKDAETLKARADRAYLIAVYTFHESLAALEAAVGQRLRPTQGENR